MGDLERFLHVADDGLPTLVRIALAHVQDYGRRCGEHDPTTS